MKLYYSPTLAPRKVVPFARHIGAPVELVPVNLGKGEHKTTDYAAMNPNQKVPLLVEDGHSIWEANAILCHLARKFAPDYWPNDERQVEIVRWFTWETAHFNRAGGTLYFEHVIKPHFNIGPINPAAVEAAQADWRRFAAVLDDHMDGRAWLVGDAPTVADFAVAAALPWAAVSNIPLGEFTNVSRWHDRMNEMPAWREGFPALAGA